MSKYPVVCLLRNIRTPITKAKTFALAEDEEILIKRLRLFPLDLREQLLLTIEKIEAHLARLQEKET